MSKHHIQGATTKPTESSLELKLQRAKRREWPLENKSHCFSPAAIAAIMGFNVTDLAGVTVPGNDQGFEDIYNSAMLRALFVSEYACLNLTIHLNGIYASFNPGTCEVHIVHRSNPFDLEGEDSEYDREYETSHIYRASLCINEADAALLATECHCLHGYATRYMHKTQQDNPFARWQYESFR